MPRYSDEVLTAAVAGNSSIAAVLRELNIRPTGGSHYHMTNRVKRMGLDTSHFGGQSWSKGRTFAPKRSAADILVVRDKTRSRENGVILRRALNEIGRSVKCEGCGLGQEWQNKPIQLEIDHTDGDCYNNTEGNLRYLCPNCHAQCETNRPWKNTSSRIPTLVEKTGLDPVQ